MSNKAWERAEQVMEEELGCSMREARETYDLISSYGQKFLTEDVTKEEQIERITGEMTDTRVSKIYKAEMIIQLNHLIENINVANATRSQGMNIRERVKFSQEIANAKSLWSLIINSVMPIEIFWAMEQSVENCEYLTEDEERLYEYMVNVADKYLLETNYISEYINYAEISKKGTTATI